MRKLVASILALMSAASLSGCADDPPPPPARAAVAVAPQGAPNEAVLARLRAGDPALLPAARWIVTSRDAVTLRAASARLVAQAQAARSAPEIAQLLPAMEIIGGPDVVAYCLWLGEYEPAPLDIRKAALAVLARWVDRNDPVARTRSTHIWERLNALSASSPAVAPAAPAAPAAPQAAGGAVQGAGGVSIGSAAIRGGTVANATTVIAGMASDFRRCYAGALQENPSTHGAARVTVKVESSGEVVVEDESHEGITPALVSCVITRIQTAKFAPPQGGPATVVIPITFDAKH